MTSAASSDSARLRRDIYLMRNGILADSLRRSGCPYRLIFGVNIPQLNQITAAVGPSEELARAMLADGDLREATLAGFMLYPVEAITVGEARRLVSEKVRWSEDADILCHALLRRAPFAASLASELAASERRLDRYTGLRLYMNIVDKCPDGALAAARAELSRPDALTSLATLLADAASPLD